MSATSTATSLVNQFPAKALLGDLPDGDVDIVFKLMKALPFLETFHLESGELSGLTEDGTIVLATGLPAFSLHMENDPAAFKLGAMLGSSGQTVAAVELHDEYLFTDGSLEVRVPRCWGEPVPIEVPEFSGEAATKVHLGRKPLASFSHLLKKGAVALMVQGDELLCARAGDGLVHTFNPANYPDVCAGQFDAAFQVFDLGLGRGDELNIELPLSRGAVWCKATWKFASGVSLITYEKAIPLAEHYWR